MAEVLHAQGELSGVPPTLVETNPVTGMRTYRVQRAGAKAADSAAAGKSSGAGEGAKTEGAPAAEGPAFEPNTDTSVLYFTEEPPAWAAQPAGQRLLQAAHDVRPALRDALYDASDAQIRALQDADAALLRGDDPAATAAFDRAGLPAADRVALEAKVRELTKPKPLGGASIVIDENVAIALRKVARGEKLQPGEEALMARLRQHNMSDLRAPDAIQKKGDIAAERFPLLVERSSPEYKATLAELEKFDVGRSKGAEDREIVCDVFWAESSSGNAVLATHDKGIYNPLFALSGGNAAKVGKPLSEAFPNGFQVTIHGRTRKVLPLPGR